MLTEELNREGLLLLCCHGAEGVIGDPGVDEEEDGLFGEEGVERELPDPGARELDPGIAMASDDISKQSMSDRAQIMREAAVAEIKDRGAAK